jgi:hypothetical protein
MAATKHGWSSQPEDLYACPKFGVILEWWCILFLFTKIYDY